MIALLLDLLDVDAISLEFRRETSFHTGKICKKEEFVRISVTKSIQYGTSRGFTFNFPFIIDKLQ